MMDIRILLNSFINSEPSETTDSKIALTIYEKLNKLKDVSSSELAELCSVSSSAITRFCKKLGLEGFYELHYLIKNHESGPQRKFFIENENSKSISLTRYMDLQIKEIENLRNQLEGEQIFKLAHMFYSHQTIVFMGALQSSASALHLQATLFSNDIVSQVISRPLKQREFLTNLKENTLVVVFSVSGKFFKDVLKKNTVSKPLNSKVVLITQNENYEKPPFCDFVINTKSTLDYSSDHIPFSVLCSVISLACYQIRDQYK